MKKLITMLLLIGIVFLFGLSCSQKSEWVQLFNGKNLDGWKVKISGHPLGENYKNTIRVEDGLLKVSYNEYETIEGKFGHIFYEKPFSHYILRAEYRFVGEQCPDAPGWAFKNNGIMFHSQSPESMELNQNFPVCIEAQMLGGNGEDSRPTGNVCSPGTHFVRNGELITAHCVNSTSKTIHDEAWVMLEIEVHGSGKVIHRIDGETVFEYEQVQYDQDDPEAKKLIQGDKLLIGNGYIAFQAESHPTEFRKIELKHLEH